MNPLEDSDEKQASSASRMQLWSGCVLLLCGLLINEFVIRSWFYDGVFWSVGKRVATALFQVSLLSGGVSTLILWQRGWSPAQGLRYLLRYHRRKSALLVAGFILVTSGMTISSIFGRMYPPTEMLVVQDAHTGEQLEAFAQEDALLGYRPVPDLAVRVSKRSRDGAIYAVRYSFDSESRRMTPQTAIPEPDRFAAFMGCSFTFGEGVNDDQTLPYYFGRHSIGYRPYNYGFSGYGPQQMLALVEQGDLPREIEQSRGLLIYVYLGFHIRRVIGSLQSFSWGAHMPYYVLEESGSLRRSGNFTSGRPWTSLWYWIAGKLRLPQIFGLDHPPPSAEHVQLLVRMVEATRDRFQTQFPDSRFVVLLYPSRGRNAYLTESLRKRGIDFFDYSALLDPGEPAFRIERDGHPTPAAHEIVARQLARDIASQP